MNSAVAVAEPVRRYPLSVWRFLAVVTRVGGASLSAGQIVAKAGRGNRLTVAGVTRWLNNSRIMALAASLRQQRAAAVLAPLDNAMLSSGEAGVVKAAELAYERVGGWHSRGKDAFGGVSGGRIRRITLVELDPETPALPAPIESQP